MRIFDKDSICDHCRKLKYALNCESTKLCLEKEYVPKKFKLIEMNKYLEKYLKADPIFFYSKEENEIKSSIDSPDWGKVL